MFEVGKGNWRNFNNAQELQNEELDSGLYEILYVCKTRLTTGKWQA